MRRFIQIFIALLATATVFACTENNSGNNPILNTSTTLIEGVPYEGVRDAEFNISAQYLTNLTANFDGEVVTIASIVLDNTNGAYQFKVRYSVATNNTGSTRSGWIELTADEVEPIRITVKQLVLLNPNRAYLGCLEVPEVSLLSINPTINSGAEYYGRQHEYATTDPNKVVVVYQFDDYGSTSGASNGVWYRNFSMLYDNSMYAAHWVAYSLSKWHFTISNSLSRPSWKDNPSLTEYSGGYKENSTYDRGHQLANMMRNQCSYNSQRHTFFHANQMPQINTFNQGQWVKLENKELVWKDECDTMYVVTGPIFDSNYKTTLDNGGTPIPVATRYYKAMIKCKWSNGKLNDVKGIGFIFAHSASAQQYTEAKTSIAEIERVLDYKLFANLPSEFSQAKQNSTPSNFTNNW